MGPKGRKAPAAKPSADGVLSKLRDFYGFMTQNGLDALELDEDGVHVKLVRRRAAATTQVPVPVYVQTGPAPAGTQAPVPSVKPVEPAPAGSTTVRSSMMGIFYRAPTPSSPPFVKEGDAVKAGQVLCMIEAMKVFNELKAEFPCTVLKVLLENGKPVRSGQDLFLVQR